MASNVIMPQLGESVVEGTISRWLIQEGASIEKYAPIVEISTDKVDTEVPSPLSGVLLKILHPAGATVRAGTAIAVIGQPGETILENVSGADALPATASIEHTTPVAMQRTTSETPTRDVGRISPVVGRIAREHAVDLTQVHGTGLDGRITKKDILAYVAARAQALAQVSTAATTAGQSATPSASATYETGTVPQSISPAAPAGPDEALIPHSRLRRLIAEHMVASKRTSPHVTTVMEADMAAVVAHRMAHKAEAATKGVVLTFTPYFIQATIAGLKAVPAANAVYRDDGLLLRRRYHIGMATAVADGLLVPVIHDADDYSLLGLARQVNDLAQRARAGQLKADEIQGSTFTITNHGTSGSLFAMPIINQPNVGILGIGAIQKRTVVISRGHPIEPSADDSIAIRPMVYLSFTFDHRVLDGAGADRFVMAVKQTLEGWR
jgi:2-oxoglutarate dehydrogenase E2 component (dihydrolipoamide succinyltransferase)